MAKPSTREQFKDNCLRRLGWPVIEINVDEDQVNDRIDEALDYYHQFHNEGTYLDYLPVQVSSGDIANTYISLNEDVIGVNRILPITDQNNIGGMFDVRYQMRLNDAFNLTSPSLSNYVSQRQKLELMDDILVGQTPIRFNRHMDRLYIDMDWDNDVSANDYIIVECWQVTDPETYTDVYSDRMLQKYCTALIKLQWGSNMKKYQGVQLIGGVEMNGQTIFDEAKDEITELEEQIRSQFELPTMFITG